MWRLNTQTWSTVRQTAFSYGRSSLLYGASGSLAYGFAAVLVLTSPVTNVLEQGKPAVRLYRIKTEDATVMSWLRPNVYSFRLDVVGASVCECDEASIDAMENAFGVLVSGPDSVSICPPSIARLPARQVFKKSFLGMCPG